MPRAKALNAYPDEFWEIVEGCAIRNEEYKIEVTGWREAMRLQGQFYSFRGALRREIEALAKRPADSTGALAGWKARVDATLRNCEKTVCWFNRLGVVSDKDPVIVHYMNKAQTPQAKALRGMLAGAKPSVTPNVSESVNESAQRLMERIKEGKL